MSNLIPLPNDHFAVTVPKGATDIQIHKVQGIDNSCITHFIKDLGTETIYLNRPGSYTLVALGSEISEEQAERICEWKRQGITDIKWHKDYTDKSGKPTTPLLRLTPSAPSLPPFLFPHQQS